MLSFRRPTPAAVGLLAFAAGLALGLFGSWAAIVMLVSAGALVAWWRRAGASLLVVAAVGIVHGTLGRRLDRAACAAQFADGNYRLSVRLVEPAPPGRPARAVPGFACRGTISVRHRGADTLLAGSIVALEGRWIPRMSRWRPADGLFVAQRTVVARVAAPTVVERLRNQSLASIGRLYGPRSGMIEALVLGSRGTIDPVLSQAFARSGLVHLLSISGFHVGLLWAWVLILFRLTPWRRHAPGVAALIVVSYVLFLGGPAPAVRASLLAILGAIQVARQRRVAAGGLGAVVAWLVLIVEPWAVTDLGAWLSVTALWGATAATRWGEDVLGAGSMRAVLSGSVGATLATAPLSALVFGSVSLIGAALNLIAIPLMAVALPPVLLSLVLAGLPVVARSLAAGGGSLLGLLEWVATQGARVPLAALTFEPGLVPATLAVVAIGVAVWVFGRRNRLTEVRRRLGWTATAFLHGTLVLGVLGRPDRHPGLALHFLSVGQGDAALIRTGAGRWILIDAGPTDQRGDAGRRVIAPFLLRQGVRRLAAVVISHGHRDHFGGLASVLEQVPADVVYEPGLDVPDPSYIGMLDWLDDHATPWRALRRGDTIAVDEVRLAVLHPDPGWDGFGDDLNENSLVLHGRAGELDVLFAGDAGFPVEDQLGNGLGPVEILKVGHHGSRTATGTAWLGRLKPALAVLSVGVNRYGHPSPEAVARLREQSVEVLRTDREGTITVRLDGDGFRAKSRRGEVAYPFHPK